jgi:ATP/maltotriose-dependent transcriptional regulator MalT
VYIAADACLSASLGDFDGAEEALARLTRIGLGALPPSSSWLTTMFLAGEAAFLLGDPVTAAEVRTLIRPYAGLPVMPSLAVVCLGSAQRTLGLTAATCGELDAAVEHLEQALRVDRELASRPMSVLTEHALATILTARGAEGDLDRAQALLARSESRASRVGVQLPSAPEWLAHRPLRRHRAVLKLMPGGWELTVEGRKTMLSDRVGMGYLATLLGTPGEDHHVLRLMIGTALPTSGLSSTQSVLDREAVSSYRSRVKELSALIEASGGDTGATAEQREELDAIRSVLRVATGQDGRSRDFPTDQERARTAVRKALVRAIGSIRTVEPELGGYLKETLATGYTCRYEPSSDWVVTVEA